MMNKRDKVLIIPYDVISNPPRLSYLRRNFDIEFLPVAEDTLLHPMNGENWNALENAASIAQNYSGRQYSAVVGEYVGGAIWATLLRFFGLSAPLILLPHTNPLNEAMLCACALLKATTLSTKEDIIMVGSKRTAECYRFLGLNAMVKSPYGIDMDIFNRGEYSKHYYKEKLGLQPHQPTIIYTGRVEPDKSVLELIDIFATVSKRVPELALIIANRYPSGAYQRKCLSRLEQISDHWLYFEGLSRPDLVDLYRASDLYVSTALSIHETFGRSPLEAMASGTPPVVPKFDGFEEHIPNSCGYLVEVDLPSMKTQPLLNHEYFVKEIITALAETETRNKKAHQGHHWVKKYAIENSKNSLVELIEKAQKSTSQVQPLSYIQEKRLRQLMDLRRSTSKWPLGHLFLEEDILGAVKLCVANTRECIDWGRMWERFEKKMWNILLNRVG